MEPEATRTVNVIVWSSDGDAIARPPLLQGLTLAMDDELALPTLANTTRERASLEVAVLAVTETDVHVELLTPVAGMTWFAPDVEIPGHASWYELGWYRDICSTIERALKGHGITRSPSPPEEPETESPFALLAELQQDAAGRIDELLALGCPDRRSAALLRDVEFLARRDDILEVEQRHEVLHALPALHARCARLDDGIVPPSLVHGDLHGGNWTRSTDGQWVIFDWTDACVAHPFLDLGVLPSKNECVRAARLHAYLDAWGIDESDLLVSDALAVAAAHHAVSYQRIVDGVRGDDGPSWHPAVRSFVGRMLESLGAP